MAARILDVSPEEYHSLPGLSSSIAKVLLARSPAHAKAEHGKPPSKILDRGSVIHRLVLGKGKDYEVIQHGDWRTNAAKTARDAARERGLVPVLAHEFEEYCIAAEAIRVKLADRDLILDGDSELAVEWEEPSDHGPVLCRGMFDHVWIARGVIFDLKITDNASPSAIERTAENLGYAVQYAAYVSALSALKPDLAGSIKFMFAFCEPDPPHAMNLCAPDGMFRELGERRWQRAVSLWAKCTAEDRWPAYDEHGINYINPPAWALAREEFGP